MDLDLWILKVKEGQHLSEDELQLLCEYVRKRQRTPWLHLGSDLVDIFCWTTEIGLVRVQLWVGSLHSTTSCSLQARAGITEVHFLPFNPVDKCTAITYIDSDGNWHRVSKGAPEQIIELCEVKPDVKRKALDIIDKFADHGLPSLAVAQQDAISYDSTLYSIMGILSVVGSCGHDNCIFSWNGAYSMGHNL